MEGAMREHFLQDIVVPICSADVTPHRAFLHKLLGTAFFISKNGIFLTAKHVMREVQSDPPPNIQCGLNVKSEGEQPENMFVALDHWENAPEPFDIAIGKVKFLSRPWFEIAKTGATHWKDVATMGYPETALNITSDKFNVHMRSQKGHIQRFVKAGELQVLGQHPDCYELSFPITSGMSGSPLFTADNNKQQLIGVCVGSSSAEIVEYDMSEINEDGKKYEERRLKVEQIGIAESIHPLLLWKPKILEGRTLEDIFSL